MPITDLQRRLREIGRIRQGEQRTSSNGKTYPAALDTFRLTSPHRPAIDAAAAQWGGTVTPWQSPAGPQWQVTLAEPAVPVIVPSADLAFSQWYELWTGGGCQRRCDSTIEYIGDQPCQCDPGARDCQPTTRLSVMLPTVPGFGLWRVESHGYNAAAELAGVVAIAGAFADRGRYLEATLRLEQRAVKRPDKDGKPVTQRFVVTVLDLGLGPMELVAGGAATAPVHPLESVPDGRSVEAQARPSLTPVPDPGLAAPSVRDQLTSLEGRTTKPPKVDLPPTGIDPLTGEVTEPPDRAPEPAPDDDGKGMAPPPSTTDPEAARRRVMAEAKRTWPDADTVTREGFRHALGIIATYTPRQLAGEPAVASVAHMTLEERLKLSTLMADVRNGQMLLEKLEDDAEGHARYRAQVKGGSRIAVVTRKAVDDWDVVVHNREEAG